MSALANRAADIAEAQIGKPYTWGSAGPNSFDCSGLMAYAWAHAGFVFPRTTARLLAHLPLTEKVPLNALQRGDMLFYANPSGDIVHVGMYLGGGKIVHAPNPRTVVKYSTVNGPNTPVFATRVISGAQVIEGGGGFFVTVGLLAAGYVAYKEYKRRHP